VVVLFGGAGISFLALVATIQSTPLQVLFALLAIGFLVFAGIFPSNVRQTRELIANAPATVARVTLVRDINGPRGPSGTMVHYEFEVKGKLYEARHGLNPADPRFPNNPKPGNWVVIVYDPKDPSRRSIPIAAAND